MKLLCMLLLAALSAQAQFSKYSHIDTLVMERWWSHNDPPIEVVSVVSCYISNVGNDTLKLEVVSISDTDDFEISGLFAETPTGATRRMDIKARRSLDHDTDCVITLRTNNYQKRDSIERLTVHGRRAGRVMAVDENHLPDVGEMVKWYDVLGRPADSTRSGVMFGNGRRKVVVR